MNHTRNMIVLLFFAVFTHNMCYTPISAVNDGGSGSDPHKQKSVESEERDIDWNNHLLQSLVHIWYECDPETAGHKERMFQMWSSNPSQLPPISKGKLYKIARNYVEKGKLPLNQEEVVYKGYKWSSEFKAHVNKFLNELSLEQMEKKQPIYNLFVEKYPQYADKDRRNVARYINGIRWSRGMTTKEYRVNKTEVKIPQGRVTWNKEVSDQLMNIWDRTFTLEPRSVHAKKIHNEWSKIFPEKANALTPLYLQRKADLLIVEDTRRRIQEGQDNPLLRKRLEFMKLRGENIEEIPNIKESLLKYWRGISEVMLQKQLRIYPHGGFNISYLKDSPFKAVEYHPEKGSHSRTPHGQESQKSIPQNFGASSSQIPQTDTHFQGYSDPRQSQPSYINFSHGGMFGSTPQFSQYHQIHNLPDQLYQRGSDYYHGESSSHAKRPGTPRLNHTSGEYERNRQNRTRSRFEASSSRGDDDDLDLDLHL